MKLRITPVDNLRRMPLRHYQIRNGPILTGLCLLIAMMVLPSLGYGRPAASSVAQVPPQEIRVNQVPTADQHEPTLAVDPTNPNNLLSAAKDWRTGPKQVWYYRSTDGGRTWADGHINSYPSELPNQSDPVIAFDASGAAYMSVLDYNQNDFSIGGVSVAKSLDMGATWQQPVLVSANSETVFNDKEWITVDRSNNPSTKGNVYVSWTLFTKVNPRTERAQILLSHSTDGGKTFSRAVTASLPDQSSTQGSYPVVGPNGEVYVLYFNGPQAEEADRDAAPSLQDTGPAYLYVAKSTDGGLTFPQVRKAAPVTAPNSPLPGSRFRIFVLPVLAVAPNNGALYAVWNDYSTGDSDVMMVSSTDGGKTWSERRKINDDAAQQRHDQFFPTASVGSDSTVHILWLDRRDDPQNLKYAPYYAQSSDGGVTFSKNMPLTRVLSDPSIGFEGTIIGDYLGLDVSADGHDVYAAWPDTRGGNQDIYFSHFSTQDGPQPQPTPAEPTAPTPVAVPSPQPLTGFTDEAFLRQWERADRPVTSSKVQRPWLWGPISFAVANEPYQQGKDGLREVQYFDKARMEINNPSTDRNSPFFVTNGLLVVELISGRVQIGDQQFEQPRSPSQVPVAGDIDSPEALTYAALRSVASINNDNRAQDRTGEPVTATLNKSGQVGDDPTLATQVKVARYEVMLGHNIPDAFWAFMNSTGPVYDGLLDTYSDARIMNWETDLGYPITEPYWTSVRIGGVPKLALVQAFQRRVLTYVADNPSGWKVEMGNVGKHYFDWRYTLGVR